MNVIIYLHIYFMIQDRNYCYFKDIDIIEISINIVGFNKTLLALLNNLILNFIYDILLNLINDK